MQGDPSPRPRFGAGRWSPVAAVFAATLLLSLPLILNPGYFSHDELQWGARAGTSGAIDWFPWLAIDAFQYRPLTFNLWLWLSRHLFAHPHLFHAAIVAWGAANAALLARLGLGFGMSRRAAAAGALAFALGPYAAYVHGWVGTVGDLAWLCCGLLIGLYVQRCRRPLAATAIAFALTAVALLGKEAAISIPPLLAIAWWFDGRKRVWLAALLGSSAAVLAYLLLRQDALLHGAREGVQYAVSVAHVPRRWLEYQLFAQMPGVPETFVTFLRGWNARVVAAALLWLALLAALWRAGPRHAGVFLLGGVAALAAVLPLARSWNHYGYAFAALTAMLVAAAWRDSPKWGRVVIGLFALLTLAHGAVTMAMIYRVGEIQAVYSPALARAVGDATDASPLRLRLAPDARPWIFARLTHEVPSYRGVAIGDRVRIVDAGEPADYLVEADGRLMPLHGPPH